MNIIINLHIPQWAQHFFLIELFSLSQEFCPLNLELLSQNNEHISRYANLLSTKGFGDYIKMLPLLIPSCDITL
jgi:hypothetical protein